MDMKFISATDHMLASHPQIILTPFIAKTIPERSTIRDIYLAQKLLEAITARIEIYTKKLYTLVVQSLYINSNIL